MASSACFDLLQRLLDDSLLGLFDLRLGGLADQCGIDRGVGCRLLRGVVRALGDGDRIVDRGFLRSVDLGLGLLGLLHRLDRLLDEGFLCCVDLGLGHLAGDHRVGRLLDGLAFRLVDLGPDELGLDHVGDGFRSGLLVRGPDVDGVVGARVLGRG